jgi:hypothetical protein
MKLFSNTPIHPSDSALKDRAFRGTDVKNKAYCLACTTKKYYEETVATSKKSFVEKLKKTIPRTLKSKTYAQK